MSGHSAHVHDARPTADPTGTLPLRRRFARAGAARWRAVARAARSAVVEHDVLGLAGVTAAGIAAQLSGAGPADSLQRLLGGAATFNGLDGAWLRPLVELCYDAGVRRAVRLAGMTAAPHGTLAGRGAKVSALAELADVESRGIGQAFSQRVGRAAADARLRHLRPAAAARAIAEAAEGVGAARTRALVEVLASRAFTEATLDVFQEAGVTSVGLIPETRQGARRARPRLDSVSDAAGSRISRERQPSESTIRRIARQERRVEALREVEVLTAGDDDVCPICEDISDGGPYGINTARGIIPAHPGCRCAFVPSDDRRFASVHEEE